jgi:alkaline phosphatase D
MKKALLVAILFSCNFLSGQDLLRSGPMLGYSELREVMIWAQMTEACIVELVYRPDSFPETIYRSAPVAADPEKAFAVHLKADSVQPGMRYTYEIYANGENQTSGHDLSFTTQPLWQHRTDPPDLRIATGSCAYLNEARYDRPGEPYGSNYRIFETIADASPDMMLWLGDNIYLREVDWFSRTGILSRYGHTRSLPELQRLLAATHHYAIWDDHDYGPNDALRSFPRKELSLEAFKLFWANNGYGVNNLGGITSAFEFGDVHFFLLDDRWHRTKNDLKTVPEQILGEEQIDWLIELLEYSRAPFKIVAMGGQVLNSAKLYENYANYEEERDMLLSRIAEEGIEGVVFLTGDRHHSEMSKVEIDGVKMYDITVSPLTSRTYDAKDEENENRIEGSHLAVHNFGLLEVTGPFGERQLKVRFMDADGNERWSYVITQNDF